MNLAPASKDIRILIVDDTPANIQSLAAILKSKGYQISAATNGKQALEVLARMQPDLILLDVMMPEMDGFETCRQLKAAERWRQIPVIFLTAKTDTADIVRASSWGSGLRAKPFNAHEPWRASILIHHGPPATRERAPAVEHPARVRCRPLKSGDEQIADKFEEVTVLFADIVSFGVRGGNAGARPRRTAQRSLHSV
jgi:CheY-like chemotaxis protein